MATAAHTEQPTREGSESSVGSTPEAEVERSPQEANPTVQKRKGGRKPVDTHLYAHIGVILRTM